jgi:putative ABC transport system permease protein
MLLSVVTRMREFGILKALGWTPANIIFMVLVESLSLSLFGAALGVALGYAGIAAARVLIAADIAVLSWQVTVSVVLAGILVGVAGGIYPAWCANSAAPANILREF